MSFPVSKSNMVQIRKTRANKNLKGFKPQLTSLIDVMTILLIYLLKSFSTEGEIITLSKDMMLPESSSQKQPKLTVTIVVNNEYILVESQPVASVEDILSNDVLLISSLHKWLEHRRALTDANDKYNTEKIFKGDITIQADKRIHFRLLKKIMYTCGQVGYNNFSLAVMRQEG